MSLTSSDPQEAAALVNAVVNAYMNEVVNDDRQQRRGRLNDLQKISAEKENEVRNKREQLKRELENIGAGDDKTMEARRQLVLNSYLEYLREFQRMRAEHRDLLGKLSGAKRFMTDLPTAEVSPTEVAALLNNNPRYRDLQSRLELQEATIKLSANKAPPGTERPELATAQAEHETTMKQLDGLKEESAEMVRAAWRIELARDIKRLESEVEISSDQLFAFEKEVEHKANEVESIGQMSVTVHMAQADLENLEGVLRNVAESRERLKVELEAPLRVTVLGDQIAPAAVPESPD